jgi:hypothetical protein
MVVATVDQRAEQLGADVERCPHRHSVVVDEVGRPPRRDGPDRGTSRSWPTMALWVDRTTPA